MSYPSKLKLKPKLCETLFLILALKSDNFIKEKAGFSLESVADYKSELMFLFWKVNTVHLQQIYHAAKSCPELVLFLVMEYKDKYPLLVAIVIEDTEITFKKSEEGGQAAGYVWAKEVVLRLDS